MIDYIVLIIVTIYCWIASFLIHELMHIKGEGLSSTGKINIHKTSLTASSDVPTSGRWSYYSGGILSGIIHLIIGSCLWYYRIWPFYVPFITFGIINFVYGIWEGYHGSDGRYSVYLITIVVMIVFWLAYFGVII